MAKNDTLVLYEQAIQELRTTGGQHFGWLLSAFGDYQINYDELLAAQATLNLWFEILLSQLEERFKAPAGSVLREKWSK